MVEINATPEFRAWYEGLEDADAWRVNHVVDLLEVRGLALGFPYSSDIKGSRYAMRELRIPAGGKALRVLYAFDPRREAVLILGGDKTGDDRWYDRAIPAAEQALERYLADIQAEEDKS